MKRYNIDLNAMVFEADDGEWVRYEDVEKLGGLNREMVVVAGGGGAGETGAGFTVADKNTRKDEIKRLKELNREMVEAMEWLLNLRSGRAKGGDDFSADAQWDDAWESAIKVIAKVEEGEGE